MFDRLIQQENYVSCFNFLDAKFVKTTWNSDETNFTVRVKDAGEVEYTFRATPENGDLTNSLSYKGRYPHS